MLYSYIFNVPFNSPLAFLPGERKIVITFIKLSKSLSNPLPSYDLTLVGESQEVGLFLEHLHAGASYINSAEVPLFRQAAVSVKLGS